MKARYGIAVLLALCSCSNGIFSDVFHDSEKALDEPDPAPVMVENSSMRAMWGDTDQRYNQEWMPEKPCLSFPYKVWKGEKAAAEAVLFSYRDLTNVTLTVSDLKCGKSVIPSSAFEVHFLGYVVGDTFNMGWYGQCAARKNGEWPTMKIADRLDDASPVSVKECNTQPVWVSVRVPSGTPVGIYEGTATINADGMEALELPVRLKVGSRELPPPAEWGYHLDYWQHFEEPAHYANAPVWSEAFYSYMRPLMKMLADGGQKCITCTISGVPSVSMVVKTRKADGSWTYDYTKFDTWVKLMMECGITEQIDCYGMIPWAYKFDYIDENTGAIVYLDCEPGSPEYAAYWTPFIKDFSSHLNQMGWYDKTYLAFDERAEVQLLAAFKVIKDADPDFKISHTGVYFDEVEKYADLICITFENAYPEGKVEERRSKGLKTTYYTCCGQRYPNQFLLSPIADNQWKIWATRAKGLDGYLNWAFDKWWGDNAASDGRTIAAPAGDRFIVYPDCRSSVRWEKTIEGIQDYEKTSILLSEWKKKHNNKKIKELESALKNFTFEQYEAVKPELAVRKAKLVLE